MTELVLLVNEEMHAATREHSQRLTAIVEEIDEVNRRLDRLYDALETDKIKLEDLAPRIEHPRIRQEQLRGTRVELERLLSDRRVEFGSYHDCDALNGGLAQSSKQKLIGREKVICEELCQRSEGNRQ
jgi:chromosome segregation ATPase